jgi:hypothetical protein
MKILYDLLASQSVGSTKFHGGGEYIKTIFNHLVINYHQHNTIEVFFDNDLFIDEYIKRLFIDYSITTYQVKNIDDLKVLLQNRMYDVLFSGLPDCYAELKKPNDLYYWHNTWSKAS